MTNQERAEATARIALAVLETIVEAGDGGAPSGPMYAALMGRMSLETYESLMRMLVRAGLLTQKGHVYYATALARRLARVDA